MNKEIGIKLRMAREKAGFSQSDIAKEIDSTYQKVSSFEIGRTRVSVETLVKLCDLYKADINYILDIKKDDDKILERDEQELLYIYRKLPAIFKPKLMGFVEMLEGLLSGPEETLAAREA